MRIGIEKDTLRILSAVVMLFLLPMSGNSQTGRDNHVPSSGSPTNAASTMAAPSSSTGNPPEFGKGLMVRVSEIQIEPNSLAEYNAILKEEVEASVRLEPGVIAIFPMSQKGNPTEIQIVEIYANREAYEAHLKTPHFQKYKVTTLKMVVSLKLVDMDATDPAAMAKIFRKMNQTGENKR
jgi:quinol monooxygenase YgiN